MHKKIKYILFAFLLSVICMKVEAKELLKCDYIITTGTTNEMVNRGDLGQHEIEITFNTKKFDIEVKAYIRRARGYELKKTLKVTDLEKMSIVQKPDLKCYNYVLFYYNGGNTDDVKGVLGKGVKAEAVYLSNDYNELKTKAENAGRVLQSTDGSNKKSANAVIIRGSGSVTVDEKEAAQKEIANAIATMKTYSYDMQKCRNDNDCSKCKENFDKYTKEIAQFKSKEQQYENLGMLEADQILEFNTLYSKIFDTILPRFAQLIETCEINPDLEEGWADATNQGITGSEDKDKYPTKPKECTSCGNGVLTDIPVQLPTFTRNLIFLLQLLIPLALIALGIYDFIRAIVASDDKLMRESQKRFIRRIIAGVLIFFAIAIVKLIFGLIPGNVNTLGCVPCFTSDASSCGETYTCNY